MKIPIIEPYKPFDHFVFRVPLFSFNCLDGIYSTSLEAILDNKYFQEAIFLASPELYEELLKYKDGKLNSSDSIKLRISLMKYLVRMCTRCTPFGLFAGCGTGKIGQEDKIILKDISDYKSHTRLDINYISELIRDITQNELIKKSLIYFPNSSLYLFGKHFRYTEYNYKNGGRKYFLSSVEENIYLSKILELSRKGICYDELKNIFKNEDIPEEEVEDYLNELIKNQILISDIEPAVTGMESLKRIIDKLNNYENVDNLLELLKKTDKLIFELDKQPIGRSNGCYDNIKNNIDNIETKYNPKFLFQSDLSITAETATISKSLTNSVLAGISVLNKLAKKNENQYLKKFKDTFYRRFENEEIPLNEVLDPEIGINFWENKHNTDSNPLIDDLFISYKGVYNNININYIDSFLLSKYENYIKHPSAQEIEITETEIENFPESWNDLPKTFYTVIETYKDKNNEANNLISIKVSGGSSAATLLSRFCHIDEELHNHVKEIIRKDEELNPDKILVEILHLPEYRMGNIIFRPTQRDYETPYLASPSVSEDYIIPLDDLMVSVINGKEIILRSKKHNKQVIPRLTNAHNFVDNCLPVYSFLCLVQFQNLKSFIDFKWGPIFEGKPFLPRLRYKNIILSPALWNINYNDVKYLLSIVDKTFLDEVNLFRKGKNIPDKVFLVQNENRLLINFNDLLSVQMLFSEIKKRNFRIEESLWDEKVAFIKRKDETFTNEIILGFYKN